MELNRWKPLLLLALLTMLSSVGCDSNIKQGLSKYLNEIATIQIANLESIVAKYEQTSTKIADYQNLSRDIQGIIEADHQWVRLTGSDMPNKIMYFNGVSLDEWNKKGFDLEGGKMQRGDFYMQLHLKPYAYSRYQNELNRLNTDIQYAESCKNNLPVIRKDIENIKSLTNMWGEYQNDWNVSKSQGVYYISGPGLGYDSRNPCVASWKYYEDTQIYSPSDAFSQILSDMLTNRNIYPL